MLFQKFEELREENVENLKKTIKNLGKYIRKQKKLELSNVDSGQIDENSKQSEESNQKINENSKHEDEGPEIRRKRKEKQNEKLKESEQKLKELEEKSLEMLQTQIPDSPPIKKKNKAPVQTISKGPILTTLQADTTMHSMKRNLDEKELESPSFNEKRKHKALESDSKSTKKPSAINTADKIIEEEGSSKTQVEITSIDFKMFDDLDNEEKYTIKKKKKTSEEEQQPPKKVETPKSLVQQTNLIHTFQDLQVIATQPFSFLKNLS